MTLQSKRRQAETSRRSLRQLLDFVVKLRSCKPVFVLQDQCFLNAFGNEKDNSRIQTKLKHRLNYSQ